VSVETLKMQIIKRAWEDSAFKTSLLADAKSAIKKAFGVELPQEIELKAVEESSSLVYLTIPPKPEDMRDEEKVRKFVWS